MPHPQVLKVLGMTPQEWGPLTEDKRNELKAKAAAILKSQKDKGLHQRIEALESQVQSLNARVARLESPPSPPLPPPPPGTGGNP